MGWGVLGAACFCKNVIFCSKWPNPWIWRWFLLDFLCFAPKRKFSRPDPRGYSAMVPALSPLFQVFDQNPWCASQLSGLESESSSSWQIGFQWFVSNCVLLVAFRWVETWKIAVRVWLIEWLDGSMSVKDSPGLTCIHRQINPHGLLTGWVWCRTRSSAARKVWRITLIRDSGG